MATSKQERNKKSANEMMNYLIRLIGSAEVVLPPYTSNTRERDAKLLQLVRSESMLSGTVSSAVSRDVNRGWTLSGSARQVGSYSTKLHSVNDGMGWRRFVSLNSNSWYSTNVGYVSEIGFRSKNGPAETMWHFDPTTMCQTGIAKPSMYYYPKNGGKIPLKRDQYIHGNSMPSVEEKMKFAGFCAVERAMNFVKLMIGLNRHQLEKLGVSIPKGILLGKGIAQDEWNNAVAQAEEDKENDDRRYYEGVLSIFSGNEGADLTLIALSNLPDNFSLQEFVDTIMQVYALAFGFPVGEFWSIASGSFGRTGEMKEQQQQATAKGELDFALSFQEQLQTYFLPSSVDFQFEQRNDKGEIVKLEAQQKQFEIISGLYKTGLEEEAKVRIEEISIENMIDSEGESLGLTPKEREEYMIISKNEVRQLAATTGLIPSEWTDEVEDVETTDLKEVRERLLDTTQISRIAHQLPDEPIVMYSYGSDKRLVNRRTDEYSRKYVSNIYYPPGKLTILWNRGSDVVSNRYW
jgi:hypothetical protein